MTLGNDGAFLMNDWSFSSLCRLAGVSKDTVNRLSPRTASIVLEETIPRSGTKPLQILTENDRIRSIHGASYTRLWNTELLSLIREFATDFQPPQQAVTGGTGLYAGEQDLFVFMVDPLGWTEIGGETFAPGFFAWNSEVGRRSVGIETFWFQAVCQNHIVWDAAEVVEFSRKHTANVHEALIGIRQIIENLVAKRDARKDGFASVIRKAMDTKLGNDAEETLKEVCKNGIPHSVAREAITIAQEKGRFTVWAVVDALTRLAQQSRNAGDRTEADAKAAKLLTLIS
jgi:histone H3/H4